MGTLVVGNGNGTPEQFLPASFSDLSLNDSDKDSTKNNREQSCSTSSQSSTNHSLKSGVSGTIFDLDLGQTGSKLSRLSVGDYPAGPRKRSGSRASQSALSGAVFGNTTILPPDRKGKSTSRDVRTLEDIPSLEEGVVVVERFVSDALNDEACSVISKENATLEEKCGLKGN